jgi:hypothetical protein
MKAVSVSDVLPNILCSPYSTECQLAWSKTVHGPTTQSTCRMRTYVIARVLSVTWSGATQIFGTPKDNMQTQEQILNIIQYVMYENASARRAWYTCRHLTLIRDITRLQLLSFYVLWKCVTPDDPVRWYSIIRFCSQTISSLCVSLHNKFQNKVNLNEIFISKYRTNHLKPWFRLNNISKFIPTSRKTYRPTITKTNRLQTPLRLASTTKTTTSSDSVRKPRSWVRWERVVHNETETGEKRVADFHFSALISWRIYSLFCYCNHTASDDVTNSNIEHTWQTAIVASHYS